MTETPPLVRISALAAPVLLMFYGVLRLIDGLDGHHDRGLAWNLGHTLFFIGFVLLGCLLVGVRQLVPAAGWARAVALGATIVGLVGVACFLWVIVGDLFAGFRRAAPLPGPLQSFGPVLFQLGALTLLILLAVVRPRRIPGWSPVFVLGGFLLYTVDLDLIPVGSLLVLAGLAPLAVARPALR